MKLTGWCYTGNGEFGYCSEINDLPDTPDAVHPLLEVQTFILPKEVSMYYLYLKHSMMKKTNQIYLLAFFYRIARMQNYYHQKVEFVQDI